MHAQSTLALLLSASLATALPSNYAVSDPSHNDKRVAELRDQIASLKAQLEAPAPKCHAETGLKGGYPGSNPSATHSAHNVEVFKTAHKSRLPATSTPCPEEGAQETGKASKPDGPKKPVNTDSKAGSSKTASSPAEPTDASEVPSGYTSGYNNGTASYTATSSGLSTGVSLSSSQTVSSSSTATLSPTYIPELSDYTSAEIESGSALEDVSKIATQRLQERNDLNGSCTFETARVRTEFRKMSNEDRKGFTDAVLCLKQKPTTVDQSAYPGVQSRYDEFVATHINMTMNIHVTADFLAWHRNYISEFESAVNDCGYGGSLPYWDWAMDAQAPHDSEVFNGDEFSLGSDGTYVGGRDNTYLGLMDVTFPPGTGGGCVHSGPFAEGNFVSTLGPLDSPYGDNVENDYDYNERCLVRDLNVYFSSRYNTYSNVTSLLLGQTDIQYFQAEMQGFVGDNKLGIHGAGHWLGGGPSQMQDFHSSPNDPVFFLHHAMIDRVWAIWQALDVEERQNAIYGTSTLNNSPPSPEKSLSDIIAFGFAGQDEVFADLMDTMGGKFCYRYE